MQGGDANDYPIQPGQPVSLFVPGTNGPWRLRVTERVADGGKAWVKTLAPAGAFTVVALKANRKVLLRDSGLREAGFTGAPEGAEVNPGNSDELRVL